MSYKVMRRIWFILSAWLVLVIGNSVAPSLNEDAFTLALVLPWWGPRELAYLVFNVGVVMLLACLGAVLYNTTDRQEGSPASRFLFTALCSSLAYLSVIVPSEYLFVDSRSLRLDGYVGYIEDHLSDKFAVIAIIVFGVSVALLGLLVEYLFYTLPKMDNKSRVTASEKETSVATKRDEAPGFQRSTITTS